MTFRPQISCLKSAATQHIEATDRATRLSQLEKSKSYEYHGIAYAIKGNDKAALPQFRMITQFDQAGDPEIQLDFAITIRRQSANPPEAATGKRKALRLKAPGARESHLHDFGTIDGERSLLRKLGHHGNTLEHI